ncbi:hypothetical protein ACIGJK_03695 [Pseudomonas iridis]|uniref:hypothetical protein n=1 Tax=Pseudomonas iridis TaxID=2710587 RepID=UPI0037C7BE78
MAKTFTAPFAQSPKTLSALVTAALGGLGTTTVTGAVLVTTAGADGAVLSKLTAMPRTSTTATGLMLFLVKASAPTLYQPVDSALMNAYTTSTTTLTPLTIFEKITRDTPIVLEAGDKLYVGAQVAIATGIVFYAEWMDY